MLIFLGVRYIPSHLGTFWVHEFSQTSGGGICFPQPLLRSQWAFASVGDPRIPTIPWYHGKHNQHIQLLLTTFCRSWLWLTFQNTSKNQKTQFNICKSLHNTTIVKHLNEQIYTTIQLFQLLGFEGLQNKVTPPAASNRERGLVTPGRQYVIYVVEVGILMKYRNFQKYVACTTVYKNHTYLSILTNTFWQHSLYSESWGRSRIWKTWPGVSMVLINPLDTLATFKSCLIGVAIQHTSGCIRCDVATVLRPRQKARSVAWWDSGCISWAQNMWSKHCYDIMICVDHLLLYCLPKREFTWSKWRKHQAIKLTSCFCFSCERRRLLVQASCAMCNCT